MKQVISAILFLTSVTAVQAAGKIFGATPTGMVDPKKRRHLERKLNIEAGSTPGHRGSSHRDLSVERDLQGDYYGGDYMQGGGYVDPMYYGQGGGGYVDPMYNNYMPPMGRNMGFGNKKTSGKKSGGKRGYVHPMPKPPLPPKDDCKYAKHLVQNPFNNDWEYICDDDDCEMLIEEAELRFPYTLDFVGTNSTDLGTVYIWGTNLLDAQGNTLTAMIYGTCTRTTIGGSSLSEAVCTFTLVDDEFDQLAITGQMSGIGGNMVVTGGSGSWAGTIGDAVIVPLSLGNGDLLDDALYYIVTLTLGYITCPAQYPPV